MNLTDEDVVWVQEILVRYPGTTERRERVLAALRDHVRDENKFADISEFCDDLRRRARKLEEEQSSEPCYFDWSDADLSTDGLR
jgi:hypothetical protein